MIGRLSALALAALVVAGCSSGPAPRPSASGSAVSSTSTGSSISTAPSTGTAVTTGEPDRVSATGSAATPAPDCAQLTCIALTFDDGPAPDTTPQLLDTLERENVTATMFLIGRNAQAYPDLVRREQAMGLEIGNHTMTHAMLSKSSAEQVGDELAQAQQAIAAITGAAPTIMRPPYAARNAQTDALTGQAGLSVIVWDTSPVDWENKTAARITDLTLAGAAPGSIVLMHDTHSWTVQAVPDIIAGLKARGYTFVTVSQLLGPTTPGELYPQR